MLARWRGLPSSSWPRQMAIRVFFIPYGRIQRRCDFGTSPTIVTNLKERSRCRSKLQVRKPKKPSTWIYLAMLIGSSLILLEFVEDHYLSTAMLRLKYGDPLNTTTFVPFTVVSKEQLSATNFIITVKPRWVRETRHRDLESYRGSHFAFDSRFPFVHVHNLYCHSNVQVLQRAWEHGTWSVEIKEPFLQIAREYTPLPPPLGQEEHDLDFGHLRFLIRSLDGGEMSSYLSRVKVGECIDMRGPHLGYDVRTRTGTVGAPDDHGSRFPESRNVVFLAGGTGVAPALQVARTMLDGNALNQNDDFRLAPKIACAAQNHVSGEEFDAVRKRALDPAEAMNASRNTSADAAKPHVTIVWANRQRADCVGCETLQADFQAATSAGKADADASSRYGSPIMQQLAAIKRRHGDHFSVVCTVDEEGSFINGPKILQAVEKGLTGSTADRLRAMDDETSESCAYHSQAATATTSGRDEPISSPKNKHHVVKSHCVCRGGPRAAGKNLLMVSGPEGFVTTFAGSKLWNLGRQRQGPIGGVVGELMSKYPDRFANWLVLKL